MGPAPGISAQRHTTSPATQTRPARSTRRSLRTTRRAGFSGPFLATRSGVEVVLNRVGAVGCGGARDHRLEGALQVQSRQAASPPVAHDVAAAGVADAGAGAADGDAAGPAADGAGEGSAVVGRERAVGMENLDARR